MDPNEQLITWLRDAHAMEHSRAGVLERHAHAARELPATREQFERHLHQAREHATRIEECLSQLGATPSAVKALAGDFMGAMQGMSTAVFQDELIKNALADYAMAHFEMGCYSSIIAAAEEAGHIEIARTCGEILREEVRMANWLEEQIPELTRRHLERAAAGSDA